MAFHGSLREQTNDTNTSTTTSNTNNATKNTRKRFSFCGGSLFRPYGKL